MLAIYVCSASPVSQGHVLALRDQIGCEPAKAERPDARSSPSVTVSHAAGMSCSGHVVVLGAS